jgi:TonB-linked SusC/RagA family outer membrane protein
MRFSYEMFKSLNLMKNNSILKRTALVKVCSQKPFRILKLSIFLLFISIFVNKTVEGALSEQQKKVTGIVTEKNGTPIPGVNVMVTGTTQGALTDADGKYSLEVPSGSKSLTFSFVGMESQVVSIGSLTKIDATMAEAAIGLEEVVVVGYGTQKKIDLTGSVSVVSAKEYENAPKTDVLDAMQGKVAGVQIINNSGSPGVAKQILIRGIQSWGASTEPLYVIDGVIMDNMSSLSPNDVETISVLKDAASCAIYGARAANGVVLITTKRGVKSGAPIISFHTYAGVQQYSELTPKLLNTTQWMELDKEAYWNAGPATYDQSPYGTQNPVDFAIYKDANGNYINTDWVNTVSRPGGGKVQNYDISMSGGDDKSNYFTSLTYFNQDGLIRNAAADRISLRFNSNHKISSFLEFGNSVNIYSNSRHGHGEGGNPSNPYSIWQYAGGNPYGGAMMQVPLSRPYEYDADGNITGYGYVRNYTIEGGNMTPLILAQEYSDDTRYYGFVGNVFLKVKILPGLSFTPRVSIDYNISQSTYFTPEIHLEGIEGQSVNNVGKANDNNMHWIADFMLDYEKTFNSVHNISALLMYSQEEGTYEYLRGQRFATPNNQIRFLDAGQLENQNVNNGMSDWSFVSYIGRINYNYSQKYFVQASVRRDGSSRFVESNRWGVFPSVSAGWRISKENFFDPIHNVVNDFKIRASIGTLGNSNVGYYPTYATLSMYPWVMGSQSGQIAKPSYALTAAANTDLQWESTLKKDLGFDASFFKSKISLSVDFFKSNTTNLLYGKPLPVSSGKTSEPTINGGEIENKGFEFIVGYQDHKGDFTYNFSANLSTVRNKILDLNGRDLRESGLEVGQPMWRTFGYTANGIVKDQTTLDKYPYLTNPDNERPIGLGDIWMVDVNGSDENGKLTGKPDGKITADDRGFIGKKYPDFTYGLSGSVTFKRWTLQVVTYGVQGVDIYSQIDGQGYFMFTSNDNTRILDRWEGTKNPGGNMPKVTKDDRAGNSERVSSFWLSDASYFKISNINLKYAIPDNICQRLRMKNLEVYGSIENLHTFTKYPAGEVDVNDQMMEPAKKIPQPRTWILGLNVTF